MYGLMLFTIKRQVYFYSSTDPIAIGTQYPLNPDVIANSFNTINSLTLDII